MQFEIMSEDKFRSLTCDSEGNSDLEKMRLFLKTKHEDADWEHYFLCRSAVIQMEKEQNNGVS